jgi:hypothetical protein
MNPLVVFLAIYAALAAIKRLFNRRHVVPDHKALEQHAKAALVVLVHMETLLVAIDQELARRERGKEVTPC